jgi:isopentenyl-diphosphate delta-isomerase
MSLRACAQAQDLHCTAPVIDIAQLPKDAAMPDYIPAWTEDGRYAQVEKLDAHRRGLRHPAVSVFVLDGAGATLLQRRAAGKYHCAGLWANACCTHPFWDEDPAIAANRRMGEELGASLPLRHAGQIEYRADVGGGMTEHEVVEMFVAVADPATLVLAPDPAEVSQTRWAPIDALCADARANPHDYAPWLRIYLAEHCGLIFG